MTIRCACMPRGAKRTLAGRQVEGKTSRERDPRSRGGNGERVADPARSKDRPEPETTEIVLRIASARSGEFESMFESEECRSGMTSPIDVGSWKPAWCASTVAARCEKASRTI